MKQTLRTIWQRISEQFFWCTRKISRRRSLIIGVVALALALVCLVVVRTCLPVVAQYENTNHAVERPFEIRLSQSVRDVSTAGIKIVPTVKGAWAFKNSGIFGENKLVFTPGSSFRVGTEYTVTLPRIQRVVIGTTEIQPIRFRTEIAPKFDTSGIAGKTEGSMVASDYVFTATLTSRNRGLRKIEFRTTPAIAIEQKVLDDTRYVWKPTGILPQGNKLDIEVVDTKNSESLLKKSVRVASEPHVTIHAKASYFTPSDQAVITFDQPIDPNASPIVFDVEGSGAWQSDTVYAFRPRAVEPGKTYHYTVKAGLRSKAGGILTSDQPASFSTTGHVAVVGASPGGNGLSQASQQIKFNFDQPVDRASVAERFSVSGGRVTGSSWSSNTYIVTVADLGFQRTITARIAPGVRPVGFGLPSTRTFSTSFTTEERSVRLNIPFFRQQFRGSCAAASLRMALSYRGIGSDDMSLIYAMGYSPRAADKSTDPMTWDDPDLMYVGDVNGSIRDGTGAGPDAPPVAKAARAFGVGAENVTGASPGWVAEQIYAGRPVIFFGAISNTGFTSWVTPSGRTVTMNLTSHARVVTGVQGEPGNPVGFWVHDPLYGSSFWSAGKLASNMSLDPYRQAVVVY